MVEVLAYRVKFLADNGQPPVQIRSGLQKAGTNDINSFARFIDYAVVTKI